MLNKVFGRLTVINFVGRSKEGSLTWTCSCSCGNIKVVRGSALRSGHTKSCGCYRSERQAENARIVGHANKKHGKVKTPEYQVWHGLKQRCDGTSGSKSNKRYHDRGIHVCSRWRNSFENFLADMGLRPSPKHQIDRIDYNKGYFPKNCRWVLPKEQQRNRSSNILITYNGKIQCIAAWAEEYSLTTYQLWSRIRLKGWSIHDALNLPIARTSQERWNYGKLKTR